MRTKLKEKNLSWLFGILCILALSACTTVTIPNTRVCSVAGVMAGGAICAHTLSDETEDMDLAHWLEFLEPQVDRGPALCVSTEDFAALQIALEKACTKLGPACTKEQKKAMEKLAGRVGVLKARRKPK